MRLIFSIALAALSIAQSVQAVQPVNGNDRLQLRSLAYAERQHYVSNLKAAYARWCKEKSNVCVNELLVRPNGMTVPSPYNQVRLDLVSNLNGKFESTRYEHEKPAERFASKTLRFSEKLKVTVFPFVWNRVEIRSKENPSTLAPLTEWAAQRMDISDTKPAQKGKLLGLVHSVTYPSIEGMYWQTLVDLGSSESRTLESLLSTLEAMGFTEVEVGSFSPIKE